VSISSENAYIYVLQAFLRFLQGFIVSFIKNSL
jgi:hypothetical protein